MPSKQILSKIKYEEKWSNVYIYVGDAVRWDSVASQIKSLGTTLKTVAASTSSAPSFASMLTGLHPSSHGTYSFSNRIPEGVATIHDLDITTLFINSIRDDPTSEDPIYTIQNICPLSRSFSFDRISEPFIIVERGPGGHAPYDHIGDADKNYFDDIADCSPSELQNHYQNKIKQDKNHFLDRLDELEEAKIREETLVIYTSDHGELLGEGGLLGHSGPMRPELVYVPTVLVDSVFPSKIATETLFRHIDLLPTIISALGISSPVKWFDGQSLGTGSNKEPGLSIMKLPFAIDTLLEAELFYEGVWDYDGGHVFTHSSRLDRMEILVGKALKSPKRRYIRRNLPEAFISYLNQRQTFGNCRSRIDAEQYLPDDHASIANYKLDEEAKNTLNNLGYMK